MSKKKEQLSWASFKTSIDSTKINARRIENLLSDGMSDVFCMNKNGTSFWIENKALLGWPKRDSTCPLRGMFEPGQIPFMRNIIFWGGFAFVLLRVGVEYYLLDPKLDLCTLNRSDLVSSAIAAGKKEIIRNLENLR
ncbi:DNA helicase [Xanthomonas phage XcP1]|uniref:Uncharacterized protein n=1 Tax=Xanthomonas phage XcP1 TaxID=2785027 RepID=A0A3S7L8K9_9CAUD|nr:DNA helicase [Xanthomonas phage XcP1]AWN08545.1 hypothetical protein XcP1_043 [Xanthomonas phage XcP1]